MIKKQLLAQEQGIFVCFILLLSVEMNKTLSSLRSLDLQIYAVQLNLDSFQFGQSQNMTVDCNFGPMSWTANIYTFVNSPFRRVLFLAEGITLKQKVLYISLRHSFRFRVEAWCKALLN